MSRSTTNDPELFVSPPVIDADVAPAELEYPGCKKIHARRLIEQIILIYHVKEERGKGVPSLHILENFPKGGSNALLPKQYGISKVYYTII